MPKITTLVMMVMFLDACQPQNETPQAENAYIVITDAELQAGDTIPVPAGDVVLTVSGAITNTNVEDTLQFDMETLEQLGLIEYSVDDQQAEGEMVTFQGVLLSDILALADATEDATNLNTIALNDYSIDIPISDALDYPVMVATKVDGERMTVERYGPIRVVYPYELYDLDTVIYDPRWIWQLNTIIVE